MCGLGRQVECYCQAHAGDARGREVQIALYLEKGDRTEAGAEEALGKHRGGHGVPCLERSFFTHGASNHSAAMQPGPLSAPYSPSRQVGSWGLEDEQKTQQL